MHDLVNSAAEKKGKKNIEMCTNFCIITASERMLMTVRLATKQPSDTFAYRCVKCLIACKPFHNHLCLPGNTNFLNKRKKNTKKNSFLGSINGFDFIFFMSIPTVVTSLTNVRSHQIKHLIE